MAANKKYALIVMPRPYQSDEARAAIGTLLECLRYAGIITGKMMDDDSGHASFILRCPRGFDNLMWCTSNKERMRSFGYECTIVSAEDAGKLEANPSKLRAATL